MRSGMLVLAWVSFSSVVFGHTTGMGGLSDSTVHFVENRGQYPEEISYAIHASDKTIFFGEDVTFALNGPSGKRWAVRLEFTGANPAARPRGSDRGGARVSYFRGAREDWKVSIATYRKLTYPDLWAGIDLVYRGTPNQLKYEFIVHPGADPRQVRLAYRGAKAVSLTETGSLRVETPLGGFTDASPRAYQEISGRRVEVPMEYAPDLQIGQGFRYGFEIGSYDPAHPLILDPAILVYCGYLGGTVNDEAPSGVAVDGNGDVYIAGFTASPESSFPVNLGPDSTHNGDRDAFVAKVRGDGTGLAYCGYIGGAGMDIAFDIAVDDEGCAHVAGMTTSDESTFPVSVGPDLTFNGGPDDAFLAKVSPDGTALLYCGYVGGSEQEWILGVAADPAGQSYVTGFTDSDETTFPVRIGPDLTFATNGPFVADAFVAKAASDGATLEYCGYIGGISSDIAEGIAVDVDGRALVTGWTYSDETTFPVVTGPGLLHSRGQADAFVARVMTDGTGLEFCGYVGGSEMDKGRGVDVDRNGNVYVTGITGSTQTDFPVIVGPDLTYNGGARDCFIARVKEDGTAIDYCGYIGGDVIFHGAEEASGVAVHPSGVAVVAGWTQSDESSFPTASGPDLTHNGFNDAFVTMVNPDGTTLHYSGYIGGPGNDVASAIAIDESFHAYVVGSTSSPQSTFPLLIGPDLTLNGDVDPFVAKIRPDTSQLFECRRGTVNLGSGFVPAAVLEVNGSFGDLNGVVRVPIAGPIQVFIHPPPGGPLPASFAFYAWFGQPDASTVTPNPYGIGKTCFPTFLTAGLPKPHKIWNNAGHVPLLGMADFPSQPAPSMVLSAPSGRQAAAVVTVQGLIADLGSAASQPGSVTNAVTIMVE